MSSTKPSFHPPSAGQHENARGGLAGDQQTNEQADVRDDERWREVIAAAAGSTHSLGLRADGTVLSTGNNADHQCEVHAWTGIQPAG